MFSIEIIDIIEAKLQMPKDIVKKFYYYLLFGILTLLALFIAFAIGVSFWYQHPQKNPRNIILIEKGASLSQITSLLAEQKILNFPFLFKVILYGTGGWRQLKAGEYLIPPKATPAQLSYILKSGEVILHPVTLIEGETSYHLTQKLLQDARFQGTCEVPPEGSLLPETYYFPRGTERQHILNHMQKAMQSALREAWEKHPQDHSLTSPQDLLVLASIVEKETALPHERPLVAAVFLNRLKQGMPLQADPTVIYELTQGKEDLGRALSRADLQVKSPYNTYLYPGLPPSPIANPSLVSITAIIYPADVPYLYFVADGSGGHIFATSLKDHQKNHGTWRKIRVEKN